MDRNILFLKGQWKDKYFVQTFEPELIWDCRWSQLQDRAGGSLKTERSAARSAVTFSSTKHYHFLASAKLFCLLTEQAGKEQVA